MFHAKLGFWVHLIFYWFLIILVVQLSKGNDKTCGISTVPALEETLISPKTKFLLYDINPGEGFNLRRDVYMRVAVLAKKLGQDWILVLPPWGPLYHWKSRDLGSQRQIPWQTFFDISSLKKYVPVMEMAEYLERVGSEIGAAYYLQYPEDAFKDGHWKETVEESPCLEDPHYQSDTNGRIRGWFWGFHEMYAASFNCLSFQGTAATMVPFLRNLSATRSVMLDRAEVLLHDSFGDAEYWSVRRSMRYNKELIKLGDEFRKLHLNSTDLDDKTLITEDWQSEISQGNKAVGGPYISVHLRRQDFAKSRPSDVPSIKNAAEQVKKIMKKFDILLVFVATDSSDDEFEEFRSYIPSAVKYIAPSEVRFKYKDGGIAIIDQWIAAHARYFIGTHESTFSFRIQEDREILGFDPSSTFNRLCPDGKEKCKQPTQWRIVY